MNAHTLNGVRLPGVCDSVREDETVLSIDKLLDSIQHAFVKEVFLRRALVEDAREGELVCVLRRAVHAVLVRVRSLGRVSEQSVSR